MVKNEVMSMVGSLMLSTLGFVRRTAEGQVLVEQQPTVEAVVVVDKKKHKKPTDNKRK
jgi:hypothetical protein